MHRYIAILLPRYVSQYFFFITFLSYFFIIIFFSYNDFHLGRRYIIISTCDFCKVIPQIHNYFVKIFYEVFLFI